MIGFETGSESRLRRFMKAAVPDFLLVLMVSVGLAFTVSYAFKSADAFRGDVVLLALMEVPMLAVLFAGSWSKRAVPISAALALLVFFGIAGAGIALTPEGVPVVTDSGINDVPESYFIFACVVAIMPVITYLLSRRTLGLVFLLLFAVLACGTVQFIYRDWMLDKDGLLAFLAIMTGIGMMFIFQTYRLSMMQARHAKSTSFGRVFAYSAAISVVCIAVGIGLYYGVVAGLGLSTPEIKLFHEGYTVPIVYYTGTYEEQSVEGDDKTDQTNDMTKDTNQNAEGNDNGDGGSGAGNGEGGAGTGSHALADAFDPNNWNPEFNRITYQILDLMKYTLPICLLIAFVTTIALRVAVRNWRLRRIEKRSCGYRVIYLYDFLVGRFRRLGLVKPDDLTPMEFALAAQQAMRPFAEGAEGDFVDVTAALQKACYSGADVTEEEYARVRSYYKAFFKNARHHVGLPKWCLWRFWRV